MTIGTQEGARALHQAALAGSRSVSEIVDAHIQRVEACSDLNAAIFPTFDQARRAAREADEKRRLGEPLGALFGVPMTIKDQFLMDGTPTSCGLSWRSDTPLQGEGPLVTRLREQGAIFIAKTNLPQLLCSHESEHGRYGPAKHPLNPSRSPGGSSGGEAALIAAGASPLGLGGDMGGSIRVPSHCCGIVGLKPTNGRFPNGDTPISSVFDSFYGFEGFVVQPGPMARKVEDLALMMDVLCSAPFDDGTPPLQWSTEPASIQGLRVGWYIDAGLLPVSPAVRRAVEEGVNHLRACGLEVVSFSPPDISKLFSLFLRLLSADGGRWIRRALRGERPIADIAALQRMTKIPNCIRPVLSWLLKAFGQAQTASVLRNRSDINADEYWSLTAARSCARGAFIQAMDDANLDLLLCPPYALPAPILKQNQTGVGTLSAAYSAIYNLLGNPAGVVPLTVVADSEATARPSSRDLVLRAASKTDLGSAGLPIGVQVVGRHWREDQVLSLMAALESTPTLAK